MKYKIINWLLFILLSLIWGSSFVLMKVGMQTLSPYHVAALRILSAGVVLIPFAAKAFKMVPRQKMLIVIVSGLLGSFFPSFLFCIAETQISSALTGMLNSLTPLFTVLIGVVFFGMKASTQKIAGILTGLVGLYFLVAPNGHIAFGDFTYILLVILATIFYAINVNLVGRHMQGIGSVNIAAVAFVFLVVPCSIVLFYHDFFNKPFGDAAVIKSTLAACVLGIVGTAIASVLFYMLVKRAGALFASMVTYGIPFIAVGWGVVFGEQTTMLQVACLGVILCGVYIANSNFSKKSKTGT